MASDKGIEVITEDSWGNDKNLSQRQLVLLLIKKINDESFKKAENLTIETNKGITTLDIRETRINGIRDLFTLLQPKFDDTIIESGKKFKESIKELEQKFWRMTLRLAALTKVEDIYDQQQKDLEIEKWEKYLAKLNYMNLDKQTPEYSGYLDFKHNIYQELFEQLIFQLERLNWLSGDGGLDE